MSKVITFMRKFPAYHSRAGEPTYFVEKVLHSLGIDYYSEEYLMMLWKLNPNLDEKMVASFYMGIGLLHDPSDKKPHTIRNGHRWKAGELASLRVWSGKPYNSPQIIFTPDQEVKKCYVFEITKHPVCYLDYWDFVVPEDDLDLIAKNDGLSIQDFKDWFKWGKKEFDGQIICWNDVNY